MIHLLASTAISLRNFEATNIVRGEKKLILLSQNIHNQTLKATFEQTA